MKTWALFSIIAFCIVGSISVDRSVALDLDPKILGTISSIVQAITGEDGQFEIQGRVIKYKAKGRVHSIKKPWVYDGTAWDVLSGVSEKAKNYKSKQGAIEHAVVKLMERLKRDGMIRDEL